MLSPDFLFLERCRQAEALSKSSEPIDLLDLSGLLRQLIMDKHSLVESVNRSKLTLLFDVVVNTSLDLPFLSRGMTAGFAIDPATSPFGPCLTLPLSQFLKHPVMAAGGHPATIKDIIKYSANALGGRHYDSRTKREHKVIASLSRISVHGKPMALVLMPDIARIVLRGLRPLIEDVSSRYR